MLKAFRGKFDPWGKDEDKLGFRRAVGGYPYETARTLDGAARGFAEASGTGTAASRYSDTSDANIFVG
jgi:hypothetical protein